MRYLKKLWVKILISLFFGGITEELYHLNTGDPTSKPVLFWGGAIITFIMLYLILYLYNWYRSKEL